MNDIGFKLFLIFFMVMTIIGTMVSVVWLVNNFPVHVNITINK